MKLVMTLLVRDEEDILPALIEYHLAQGVDFLIATDNRSEDGTAAILRSYEKTGRLRYLYEASDDYSQHRWVTRMAQMALDEYQADWVINSDADEFWWPEREGSLKDALSGVPSEVAAVSVPRVNFLPWHDDGAPVAPFWERMIIRERESLNALGAPLPPKVCHRALTGIEVAQGNHSVAIAGRPLPAAAAALRILHFPLRSYRQFEAKIVKGGAAYQRNTELDPAMGNTWRRLYAQYQAGTLPDYYTQQAIREPQLARALTEGLLLEDTRLRDRLRGLPVLAPPAARPGIAERLSARLRPWLGRRESRRRGEGIVTLADHNYFDGLRLLHASVQADYPVPITCYDLGLTEDQRRQAARHMPAVTIRPIPDTPQIAAIRRDLDGPPLAKREKRQWPLWICPFLIAAAPFRRVFWMDCDMVVLRDLRGLFRLLDDGPVFTPENNAPQKTANDPELYRLLPIERPFDLHTPLVNGGLSGWDLERDRDALAGYMYPIEAALQDPRIRSAISWHDQGCLIWSIQSRGLEGRVTPTWRWNLCVRHTRIAGQAFRADDAGVLERLRAAVPDAAIVHWNGATVPWLLGKAQAH